MSVEIKKTEYVVDAKGKRLGKLATEIASILLGKNSTNFVKHKAADVSVKVLNASLLDVPEKKKFSTYQTYSGYPGGRKVETLEHLGKRRGYGEVIKRTVSGMLPKNKLFKEIMKNLVITE